MKGFGSGSSGEDRIWVTPRKYVIADILTCQYWSSIKKQIQDNPGKTARLKFSWIKKLLKRGFFDPDITDKTARDAIKIFGEKCIIPEGYRYRLNSDCNSNEDFLEIWLPSPEEEIPG